MPGIGNAMTMMAAIPPAVVSFAGEAGQLLRGWWAGGWLAFCTLPTILHRWLCNEGWPLYAFSEIIKWPKRPLYGFPHNASC